MDKKNINVLMCGSKLEVKGGMVSVIKNYLEYDNWENINIIYIPTHIERNKLFASIYFCIAYIKIIFLCLMDKIEIAHLHTAERGSFFRKAILVRSLRKFKVKTIMHHHAAEFEQFYSGLSKNKKKYVNKTLEMVDVNIVLSESLVDMIINKASKANVKVLYNAVNTYKENKYNKKASNILFLGRLGKRKGIYDLLEAIKKIDEELPENIKFYFCGDGDVDKVKEEVDRLEIKNRILHIGWITKEEKAEFFEKTMINILPSYNEGLPMSILETMAYGIPNITTNIASIPEVVFDKGNGLLISPGDSDILCKSILDLSKNEQLRSKFSKKSFVMISEKFSLNNNINLLKEIYYDLMNWS